MFPFRKTEIFSDGSDNESSLFLKNSQANRATAIGETLRNIIKGCYFNFDYYFLKTWSAAYPSEASGIARIFLMGRHGFIFLHR